MGGEASELGGEASGLGGEASELGGEASELGGGALTKQTSRRRLRRASSALIEAPEDVRRYHSRSSREDP